MPATITSIRTPETSFAQQRVALPDLAHETRDEARRMLKDLGLAVTVQEVPGFGTENEVYRSEPGYPALVPVGSTVVLWVIQPPVESVDVAKRFDRIDQALVALIASSERIEDAVTEWSYKQGASEAASQAAPEAPASGRNTSKT